MKFFIRIMCIIAVLTASLLFVHTVVAAPTIGEQFNAFASNKGGNFGTAVDPRSAVANTIKTLLTFMGLLTIILIIYAGVMIMTSGGNEDKVTKGKKILIGAVIGLAIIVSSYAITLMVTQILLKDTKRQGFEACIQRPTNVQKDVLGESINEGNGPSFLPYCDSF